MTRPDTLYRRILVATGGAPHSQRAVERAIALAAAFDAPLHVVTVVPVTASPLLNMAASLPGSEMLEADALENERVVRERHLGSVAAQARARGLTVSEHLVQAARPADAIVRVASEVGADLVVIGRRTKGVLGGALVGSTADAVSHAAPVDVLVVR
ncbi:universal stress protein [Deinococcus yavapaiensis]|uniref:Universal stress protein A n=1 Tax=Deinococcus yavapaiensis KR-236 TaxID=694435 RepID=A0A318SDT2_9DEIO|nr:universal stress protein [Deinococcus yavapaiensis]PYE55698.1 universal stress protein A [Deinococcus yavapaiensis KR-236]